MPLGIACTNEQQVVVTAAPQTAGGRPAQVHGPLRVTVQEGTGTAVQDPAEPLVFRARSGDGPGTTIYLVEADADMAEGVEQLISDLVTLEVSGASAVSFGLVAGAVEPKV